VAALVSIKYKPCPSINPENPDGDKIKPLLCAEAAKYKLAATHFGLNC
jgi:hypothetical protein